MQLKERPRRTRTRPVSWLIFGSMSSHLWTSQSRITGICFLEPNGSTEILWLVHTLMVKSFRTALVRRCMSEPINVIYCMFVSNYVIDKLNAVVFWCSLRLCTWSNDLLVLPSKIVHRSVTRPMTFIHKSMRRIIVTSMMLRFPLVLSCTIAVSCLAPPGDWDRFNFAPLSRVVTPTAIHSSDGQITNPSGLVRAQGNTTFLSSGSWLALDFGVEAWLSLLNGLNID